MKFQLIPRDKIRIGEYQLRFRSGVMKIEDLARSIKQNGLICPLAVSRKGDYYSLIAGERRLLACEKLGWEEIPCVILDQEGDADILIQGIVENIERIDLSPLERAEGFEEVIDVYGTTEEEVAEKIGRTQSYVSHHRRLLRKLNPAVLKYLHEGKLTFGHAQALMTLDDLEKQLEIANKVVMDELTVKDTWLLVDLARPLKELTENEKELNAIEEDLMQEFKKEWRKSINVRTGKKRETVLLRFGSRDEIRELARRLLAAVS